MTSLTDEPYPLDENGRPFLRTSVVTYLDILGSSAMARDVDAQSMLERLHEALEFARSFGLHSDNPWYRYVTFTDHISVGWPITDDAEIELGGTLSEVARYQFALARGGMLARGGIATGEAYFGEGYAFGPAVVEAAELESQAIYPRVIVTDHAIELIRAHGKYYGGVSRSPYDVQMLLGPDGRTFVDYLYVVNDEEMDGVAELGRHRDAVQAGLFAHGSAPRVFEKYVWLADYHNYSCRLRYPDNPELLLKLVHTTRRFERLSASL